jgi:hypothetical protein
VLKANFGSWRLNLRRGADGGERADQGVGRVRPARAPFFRRDEARRMLRA